MQRALASRCTPVPFPLGASCSEEAVGESSQTGHSAGLTDGSVMNLSCCYGGLEREGPLLRASRDCAVSGCPGVLSGKSELELGRGSRPLADKPAESRVFVAVSPGTLTPFLRRGVTLCCSSPPPPSTRASLRTFFQLRSSRNQLHAGFRVFLGSPAVPGFTHECFGRSY